MGLASPAAVKPDGSQGLEAVDGGDGEGGGKRQSLIKGEGELPGQDARPDARAKAEGEGESHAFREEENRSDKDIVDLGKKAELPGKSVGDGEEKGGEAGSSQPRR